MYDVLTGNISFHRQSFLNFLVGNLPELFEVETTDLMSRLAGFTHLFKSRLIRVYRLRPDWQFCLRD